MPTMREVPAEAEIPSHQLMLRAGLMRKVASGIYSFLPLGYRVMRKVENIVREEMDRAGAQELLMPAVLPAEYYQRTGRWERYGPEMFRLKDRNERDFCLGPTHEEIFTDTVNAEITSYRQLPVTLYQIQTKYRDERRPRFGVMRSREFIMKDAYSFDRDCDGLDESYRKMHDAYVKIFDRCGLDYKVVEADSGAIGGSNSQEFMVKSAVGEATVVFCKKCDYAANIERAECVFKPAKSAEADKPLKKVHTPDSRTIEELVGFLKAEPKDFVKTLIYNADGKAVAVLIRGDRELNETKLQNLLDCVELDMADAETVRRVTNAEVGFAGPIGLNIEVIADNEIEGMKNFIVGANETGYHLTGVNPGRDFKVSRYADLRNIEETDPCPKCGGHIELAQGIEVGHIFKLGTKYSKALECVYIDEGGKEQLMVMGCYGIGINRTVAAIIEQNHDENGIIWPLSVAPYQVIITPANFTDPVQKEISEKLYAELSASGMETILDDRDERPGVKFKDADLIGIPIRITVGRKAPDGIVELKMRSGTSVEEIKTAEVKNKIAVLLQGA